jgi:Na+-translocating ferredoxin:NAD+ oxidoreductase RnfD subunit
MRWTTAAVVRLVTFVLAIVVAAVVGNQTDSFWYGLLTWFIAMAVGRVIGALIRNLPQRALYKAIWPVAATVFAFLFAALGLPPWANFFVAFIAASLTKQALGGMIPGGRTWTRTVEWRRLDLDELLP